MVGKKVPDWRDVHTVVFDFDGVFTDNRVSVDQNGVESVCCDRGDGLAFDLLRQFVIGKDWKMEYFILSKEKNAVVSSRARKLQVSCVQNVSNKVNYLNGYLAANQKTPQGLVYVGNDLNDLAAIRFASFSIAPSDAHPLIRQEADLVLQQRGGNGFVRAVVELLIGLEKMSVEEVIELF